MTARGAVFLDRDDTIIEDPGYLGEPDRVVLLPGAADALAELAAAGWPLVVVSNQSAIGRGLFGPEAFHAVMRRIEQLLEGRAHFLASYYCPHVPGAAPPCDCRKPGVALFRRAALEHGLDPARSWYVGDKLRDVEPALTLGGRGILLSQQTDSPDVTAARNTGVIVARDLSEAAARILSEAA